MASVLAFDDANTVKKAPGNYLAGKQKIPGAQTKFFGSRDHPELPHACLNQRDAGAVHVNRTHFHAHDQFQIVIAGTGRLGRHDLAPTCVHFTRAYTPYGPLVSDAATGLSFFVLRAHYDAGAQHMPEEAAQLKAVSNRQPWQVTSPVTFPEFATGKPNAGAILQPIEAVKDEHGLAGYTLIMKPNAKISAPDPTRGDGQYIVVRKGSLLHENKEHKALALVFVGPKENQFPIHAGAQGLEAIILNFPEARMADAVAPKRAKTAGYKQWQCSLCSFFYDEALGMPHEGIAPGTSWEDVPDSWSCPDCAASKSDFAMVEV